MTENGEAARLSSRGYRSAWALVKVTAGLTLLSLSGPAFAVPAAQVQAPLVVEHRCSQTLVQFFKRLDRLNRDIAMAVPDSSTPTDVWALMAPGGSWKRENGGYADLAGFAATIAKLPAGLVTAHSVSNLEIEAQGRTAKADFYLTISSGTWTGALPVNFDKPGAILLVKADLIDTPKGCRIAAISSTNLFRGQGR